MVWRRTYKTWVSLTDKCITRSYSPDKNLFDSISEGAWELPSYLFLIIRRFHVNNDDIAVVMRHACERV